MRGVLAGAAVLLGAGVMGCGVDPGTVERGNPGAQAAPGAATFALTADLLDVSGGGQAARVAVLSLSETEVLYLRVKEEGVGRIPSPGTFLQGRAAPVDVECVLTRESAGEPYSVSSCTGSEKLQDVFVVLPAAAKRVDLDEIPTAGSGKFGSGVSRWSVEGDNCRAYCDYQRNWGYLGCYLLNPTPGCFDQVTLYWIACSAGCPL